jgi:RNA polymerase sigma-70 factor (family 1)
MAVNQTLSDSELTNLLRESNHRAYTEIYNRYFTLLYTHAYKKLRDEEQAKDIVQDVFTSLWYKRDTNFIGKNLAGYLYIAVRNKIFDLFAHEKVKDSHLLSLRDFISFGNTVSADYLIREKQLKAYIEKEIQGLSPKMRLIFEMSRKEHRSHKEIAAILNTTENNVSKQIQNALNVLRTKLGLVMYIYFLIKFR